MRLPEVLNALSAAAAGWLAEQNNELVVNGTIEAPLYTDEIKLRRILENLVENAAKFTVDGKIEVTYSVDSEGATFRISDTGSGNDDAAQEKIVEAFTQIDQSATRVYGGAGLGLAMCKNLCDLLEGRISISSEPGFGTTFAWSPPITTDLFWKVRHLRRCTAMK